jgi:hypothetical protein
MPRDEVQEEEGGLLAAKEAEDGVVTMNINSLMNHSADLRIGDPVKCVVRLLGGIYIINCC